MNLAEKIAIEIREMVCGPFSWSLLATGCYLTLMDGWMDDLQFYALFTSISVISVQLADDNERPFTVEKISPRAGLELRPLGQ